MQQSPKNVYNTFRGYAAENKELFDIDIEQSLIIKHLKNLCNNETATYEYTLKTLARKVQQPHKLTNTALIFKSKEGAGKDIFFNFFGNRIIGSEYYYNTDKPELLFGKFNSCIENKILVIMNETSGKDTYQINENIKCAITAENNTIEHKGMKQYKNTNHIEYVFLTNNENPIKVPQGDRRFCGIECNNNICNDKEYFDALRTEIDSGTIDRAFFNYMMSIDVDNYDFTNNRPITQFYNDMKEMNTPPMALFLESVVMNNNTDIIHKEQASILFRQYSEFITTFHFKNQPTLTKFILDIKKVDGVEQKRSKSASFIIFDLTKLKQYLITTFNINFDISEDDINDDDTSVLSYNLLDK
jgi:putative DNA primase/helicase